MQRTLVEAFKTSNKERNPLPDDKTLKAAYAAALKLVQPPLDAKELQSLKSLETQPKATACRLMIRLLFAVEQLDRPTKAVIYRMMMNENVRP